MKKMTKLVSMLLIAALLVIAPGLGTMTAKAAAPLTYSLGYDTDMNEWRWQINPTCDVTLENEPISKLDSYVKDGDIIVVYNEGAPTGVTFNVSTRLSNLTIIGTGAGVSLPYAGGIDEFFALKGCMTAVNADIKNAHVYDNCIVTFNKNVEDLEIISQPTVYNAITSSTGTIGHAKSHYDGTVHYEVYNVAAGKFVSEYTVLQTDPQYYSTTPTGTPTAAPAAPSTSTSSSGEYDDVPKTGEAAYIYMLCGLSLICFLGSRKLRRA